MTAAGDISLTLGEEQTPKAYVPRKLSEFSSFDQAPPSTVYPVRPPKASKVRRGRSQKGSAQSRPTSIAQFLASQDQAQALPHQERIEPGVGQVDAPERPAPGPPDSRPPALWDELSDDDEATEGARTAQQANNQSSLANTDSNLAEGTMQPERSGHNSNVGNNSDSSNDSSHSNETAATSAGPSEPPCRTPSMSSMEIGQTAGRVGGSTSSKEAKRPPRLDLLESSTLLEVSESSPVSTGGRGRVRGRVVVDTPEPTTLQADCEASVSKFEASSARMAHDADISCLLNLLHKELKQAQSQLCASHDRTIAQAERALRKDEGHPDVLFVPISTPPQVVQGCPSPAASDTLDVSLGTAALFGEEDGAQSHDRCRLHGSATPTADRKDACQLPSGPRGTLSSPHASANLVLHDIWASGTRNRAGAMYSRLSLLRNNGGIKALQSSPVDLGALLSSSPTSWWDLKFGRFILDPSSACRLLWDMISFLLLVYDIVAIPLVFFDVGDSPVIVSMSWVTRIFWTFDIVMSFFTGYTTSHGHTELRPGFVARHYLKRWFSTDATLVVIDWAEVMANSLFELARIGKAARWVRVVRLLRVIRMRRIFSRLSERIRSEWLLILADLARNMIMIVGLSHFIACCWYGLARADENGGWVSAHKLDVDVEISFSYIYFTSLHWSLSQFTGGMDEVRPQGLAERLFAVFVFVVAFVVSAIFVSSTTSSMTRLHILASRQSRELAALRWYLQKNSISSALATRILRNAQAVMRRRENLAEDEVDLLRVVSDPLKIDLHFELYVPVIDQHPFFQRYISECPQVVRRVCHTGIIYSFVSEGDTVFDAGSHTNSMYIVVHGHLKYVSVQLSEHEVSPPTWISEPTLWMRWIHHGTLTAQVESKLCSVDAKQFQNIVGKHMHFSWEPRMYAVEYLENMKHLEGEITDLPMGFESRIAFGASEMAFRPSGSRGSRAHGSTFTSMFHHNNRSSQQSPQHSGSNRSLMRREPSQASSDEDRSSRQL